MLSITNNNTSNIVNNSPQKPASASLLTSFKKTLNNKTFQATLGTATLAAAAATAYYFTRSTSTTQLDLPCEGMSLANHTLYPPFVAKPFYNQNTTLNNTSTIAINNATNLTSITSTTLNPTPATKLPTTAFNRNSTAQLLDLVNSNTFKATNRLQDKSELCQEMSLANHTLYPPFVAKPFYNQNTAPNTTLSINYTSTDTLNNSANLTSINNTTANDTLRATTLLQDTSSERMSAEENVSSIPQKYLESVITKVNEYLSKAASLEPYIQTFAKEFNTSISSFLVNFLPIPTSDFWVEDDYECKTSQQLRNEKLSNEDSSTINKNISTFALPMITTLGKNALSSFATFANETPIIMENLFDSMTALVNKAGHLAPTIARDTYTAMENFGDTMVALGDRVGYIASITTESFNNIMKLTGQPVLETVLDAGQTVLDGFLETFNPYSNTNMQRIRKRKN